MNYRLDLNSTAQGASFIGGTPRVPVNFEWPNCRLCGQPLEFFFQIEFPSESHWPGKVLQVFACVSCASEDALIPEMLPDISYGHTVPEEFLVQYQTNFRFVVYDGTDQLSSDGLQSGIAFQSIKLTKQKKVGSFGYLGDEPFWLLENESPGNLCFLLQLKEGLVFPIIDSARAQVEIGLTGELEPSTERHYKLFLGNAVYFFGPNAFSSSIYVITQV